MNFCRCCRNCTKCKNMISSNLCFYFPLSQMWLRFTVGHSAVFFPIQFRSPSCLELFCPVHIIAVRGNYKRSCCVRPHLYALILHEHHPASRAPRKCNPPPRAYSRETSKPAVSSSFGGRQVKQLVLYQVVRGFSSSSQPVTKASAAAHVHLLSSLLMEQEMLPSITNHHYTWLFVLANVKPGIRFH